MYRRVLLGSDFSTHATAGARLAAALAAPDAALLALHVAPGVSPQVFAAPAVGLDPVPGLGWGQVAREGILTPETEQRLRAKLEAWIDETGVRRLDGRLLQGDVANVLLEQAEKERADLLVLGARGHTRLEEVLLGSTAKEALRHAPCDVLLAESSPLHAIPPGRIAVATSFDEASARAARVALDLADRHGAQLLLLHAIGPGVQTGASYGFAPTLPPLDEEPGWLERAVDEKLVAFNREHLAGRATPHRGRGHMAQEIRRLAHETRADLLVAGHHGAGFWERLILGSVTENVARHPPCSTLFVKG